MITVCRLPCYKTICLLMLHIMLAFHWKLRAVISWCYSSFDGLLCWFSLSKRVGVMPSVFSFSSSTLVLFVYHTKCFRPYLGFCRGIIIIIILPFLCVMLLYHILHIYDRNWWLQIIKLARKLPTGDLSGLKTDDSKDQEEPLDENDLT